MKKHKPVDEMSEQEILERCTMLHQIMNVCPMNLLIGEAHVFLRTTDHDFSIEQMGLLGTLDQDMSSDEPHNIPDDIIGILHESMAECGYPEIFPALIAQAVCREDWDTMKALEAIIGHKCQEPK